MKQIRPQKGYQEKALSCPADIIFGGGSAGAGKTFELLLEPMKGFVKPGFRGIIFRRTGVQIKGGGGLWDESVEMYQHISGSKSYEGSAKWRFRKNIFKQKQFAELKFSHLEYEKDKYNHQGLQYAFIGFDELTHFSRTQFLYLLSRNRSICGIKPFIRCTCNPDPESWVVDFIDWYLDEEGYVIKERDGIIRYFTMDKNNPVWGNTKQEVIDKCPHIFDSLREKGEDLDIYIKSFTFIEGSLDENKELLNKDKTYKANLMAQDEITKHALLHKCWKPIQDNLAIVNYQSLDVITSNFLDNKQDKHYISIDIAGFGKDLAVLFVWKGWEVVKIRIWTKSGPEELYEAIEGERKIFNIPKYRVVYDFDGMGWGLAGKQYISFKGGDGCLEYNLVKDYYKNLKTQCSYRIIEDVLNKDLMKITDIEIYVDGKKTNVIIMKNKEVKVIDIIKADIKSIKRSKIDTEGRRQMSSKEEQKNILGRSPDFSDTLMMRFLFELDKKKTLLIL